jgi:hypothetical protein
MLWGGGGAGDKKFRYGPAGNKSRALLAIIFEKELNMMARKKCYLIFFFTKRILAAKYNTKWYCHIIPNSHLILS